MTVRVLLCAGEGPADALLAALVTEVTGADRVRIGRRCPRCGSTDHGVPRVLDPDTGLHLSLSRAAGRVLVAVAEAPVGVDLEAVHTRPVPDQWAPGEPPAAGDHGALRSWTRKEAVLKAAGTGLSVDPRTVPVSDHRGAPAAAGYWLADLDLAPGFVAAVALALPPGVSPVLRWSDHRA